MGVTNRVVRPDGTHPGEWRKGHMRGDILTASCEVSLQTVEVLIRERCWTPTGETSCQQRVSSSFQVSFNSRNQTQLLSVYTTECFWYWSTGQHLFIIQINLMFWYLELSAFNILGSSSHKAALKNSNLNPHCFTQCIFPFSFYTIMSCAGKANFFLNISSYGVHRYPDGFFLSSAFNVCDLSSCLTLHLFHKNSKFPCSSTGVSCGRWQIQKIHGPYGWTYSLDYPAAWGAPRPCPGLSFASCEYSFILLDSKELWWVPKPASLGAEALRLGWEEGEVMTMEWTCP